MDYADSTSTARKGENMSVEENNNVNQANSEKRTYSVQEIADILQISRSMAYNLCQQSLFKIVRVGIRDDIIDIILKVEKEM